MHTTNTSLLGRTILAIALTGVLPAAASAQSTSFSYQGRLERNGQAQSGTFQFTFQLFETPTANPQSDTPLWQSGVLDLPVTAGLFSTLLGPIPVTILRKPALYLALSVKGPGDATSVPLGGLQQIVPVPQAAYASIGVPAGTIVAYAGANAPSGWLFCDGSAASSALYPDLYAAIGERYGLGDDGAGTNSFSLPNLGGRVPIGVGTVRDLTTNADVDFQLGAASGTVNHRLTVAELATHAHDYQHYVDSGVDPAWATATNDDVGTGPHFNTGLTGGDQPHNNLQPYLAVNYIIKY